MRQVLAGLEAESVDCCVTSPPYWGLRDYGHAGQIGLEPTPEEYVSELVDVFAEVRRLLRPRGSLWLNIGDSYSNEGKSGGSGGNKNYTSVLGGYQRQLRKTGRKPKDLVGVPWLLAFALQRDGWWIRAENIWHKTNTTPEAVKDRTTRTHEHVFHLTRSAHYDYDADAIAEPAAWERWGAQTWNKDNIGRARLTKRLEKDQVPVRDTRNLRSVWPMATANYPDAHYAVMPDRIAEIAILSTSPAGGMVLDPFMGAGTTALAARRLGRNAVGVEISEESARLCARRLQQLSLLAGEDAA